MSITEEGYEHVRAWLNAHTKAPCALVAIRAGMEPWTYVSLHLTKKLSAANINTHWQKGESTTLQGRHCAQE